MNRTVYSAVDYDVLGLDAAGDVRLRRNDKRRTVHVALNLTVYFDQSLSGDTADNF